MCSLGARESAVPSVLLVSNSQNPHSSHFHPQHAHLQGPLHFPVKTHLRFQDPKSTHRAPVIEHPPWVSTRQQGASFALNPLLPQSLGTLGTLSVVSHALNTLTKTSARIYDARRA